MTSGTGDEMYPRPEAFGLGWSLADDNDDSLENGQFRAPSDDSSVNQTPYRDDGLRQRRVKTKVVHSSAATAINGAAAAQQHAQIAAPSRLYRIVAALCRIAKHYANRFWTAIVYRILLIICIPFVAAWRWILEPLTRPVRLAIAALRKRMNERAELAWNTYEREYEQAASSCWRRRWTFLRLCSCCWSALGVITYVVSLASGAHVLDSAHGSLYVRDGLAGVLLNATSAPIGCAEVRSGVLDVRGIVDGTPDSSLARLMVTANDALMHDENDANSGGDLVCVCAPMFGKRRRHIAVRARNNSITHMFNPVLDTSEWWLSGDSNAKQRAAPEYMIMRERQTRLFPSRLDAVENVRARQIRVAYDTSDSCVHAVVEMVDDRAYCTQQCLDLLDGISVYERAVRSVPKAPKS